jgi:hypothetical protein
MNFSHALSHSCMIAGCFAHHFSTTLSNAALVALAFTHGWIGRISRLSSPQYFLEASRNDPRMRPMMHVYHQATATRPPPPQVRPLSSSQGWKNTSLTPLSRMTVSTAIGELCTFTTGPGSEPQNVFLTFESDSYCWIDRSISHLSVLDLQEDHINENACRNLI